MQEKSKPSTLLLNGQAVALISLGRHTEAESLIHQALDIVRFNPISTFVSQLSGGFISLRSISNIVFYFPLLSVYAISSATLQYVLLIRLFRIQIIVDLF